MGLLSMLFGTSKPEADFDELLKNGATVIDVRSPSEFNAGHYKGSLNIPLDVVHNKIDEIKKMNKEVILVCRSGNRASSAKQLLTASGISAFNAGAWQNL